MYLCINVNSNVNKLHNVYLMPVQNLNFGDI